MPTSAHQLPHRSHIHTQSMLRQMLLTRRQICFYSASTFSCCHDLFFDLWRAQVPRARSVRGHRAPGPFTDLREPDTAFQSLLSPSSLHSLLSTLSTLHPPFSPFFPLSVLPPSLIYPLSHRVIVRFHRFQRQTHRDSRDFQAAAKLRVMLTLDDGSTGTSR